MLFCVQHQQAVFAWCILLGKQDTRRKSLLNCHQMLKFTLQYVTCLLSYNTWCETNKKANKTSLITTIILTYLVFLRTGSVNTHGQKSQEAQKSNTRRRQVNLRCAAALYNILKKLTNATHHCICIPFWWIDSCSSDQKTLLWNKLNKVTYSRYRKRFWALLLCPEPNPCPPAIPSQQWGGEGRLWDCWLGRGNVLFPFLSFFLSLASCLRMRLESFLSF